VPERAGLGLRVRTARAVAVVLSGEADGPALRLRRELGLWQSDVPESRQPFHAGLGLPSADARRIVARASRAVHRASKRALRALVEELADEGVVLAGAGVVVSSDTDPATIRNPHMHAHAAEGRLFRDAVVEAAASCALRTRAHLNAQVVAEAARHLGRREKTLSRTIAELGRRAGPPWRADEKAACAAALLVLGPDR
jgi:hypothetical protein